MSDPDTVAMRVLEDVFGLTEFQKIAARAILDELPDHMFLDGAMPPEGSREEKLMMDLGAIVSEGMTPEG